MTEEQATRIEALETANEFWEKERMFAMKLTGELQARIEVLEAALREIIKVEEDILLVNSGRVHAIARAALDKDAEQ